MSRRPSCSLRVVAALGWVPLLIHAETGAAWWAAFDGLLLGYALTMLLRDWLEPQQ